MVQFVNLPQSARSRLAESLGQSLGGGLADFTGNYFANKKLDEVLSDPAMKDAELSERQSKLQSALSPYGQYGQNVLQKRMGVEQQMQKEQEQNILSKITQGKEVSEREMSKLSPENQFKVFQQKKNKETSKNFNQNLVNMGFDEKIASNLANAYENATEGGKTEIIKAAMDLYNRKQHKTSEEPNKENAESQGEYPEISPPEGMTPKELASYQGDLRKENLSHFEDTQRQSRFLKKEKNALNILDSLSEKLPEGIGSIVIDPNTGDIRPYAQLSGIVNPETQRFLKTIYDFTTSAKDSFGARVTNFDLQTFLKRLPSLLNSREGRAQIIQQMKIMNELNSKYENGLKDVYQHYGLGKVPYEKAVHIVEDKIAPEEERLIAEFDKIGQPQKKQLTPDVMDKYLDAANNDPIKAAELARQDQYEF
jgi:hypothetical protein